MKTPAVIRIVCRNCGETMERIGRSHFWHCTNHDMSHRALVPQFTVKNAVEKKGHLFERLEANGCHDGTIIEVKV